MTTLITLIRHGATEWNSQRIIMGQGPLPLSDLGAKQAQLLVPAIQALEPFDAVYSSDLLRCLQTIKPAADTMGFSVMPDARFREIDYGYWQGMTRAQISEYAPDQHQAFEDDHLNYVIPGGESHAAMAARVLAGVQDILAEHEGQHVLVVCHGGPIRAVLPRVGACSFDDVPWIYNTSITTLELSAEAQTKNVVRMVNVDHLPEDMRPH